MRLCALRLNNGLSVRQAAAKIGVARGTLERAERGDSVHPGSAKRIADFYGVLVTDLWPVVERADADDEPTAPDAIVPSAAECPRCGHAAGEHSHSRDDDYACQVDGCDCCFWLPAERDALAPLSAKDAA